METRSLGKSELQVPLLSLGTANFGGTSEVARAWGVLGMKEATRLVDVALDAGVNLFDTANVYTEGESEEILGRALKGRRDRVLISTKAAFRHGPGPHDIGCSREALTQAVETSLRRLQTDRIDLFQLHAFDALTPVEEVISTLDALVRAGKIRFTGCSNFSGWHLMKSLAASDRLGAARYVAHQAYYSLVGRDYEWELMPLGLDQGVGCVVWSPLGWGRLTGRIRRGRERPPVSRLNSKQTAEMGPPVHDEHLFRVVDTLDEIARECGHSIPQVAINWLTSRPTVSTIVLGARTEDQLKDNLGSVGWKLTADQIGRLDRASAVTPAYPYWHQKYFSERNPAPV
ncbi:MAG TPA: aldo/keto reductase [Candidatus Didemnitutus sp.]|jgi:aryl-alcohol dehydrogenase-like predicted oxidoreductase